MLVLGRGTSGNQRAQISAGQAFLPEHVLRDVPADQTEKSAPCPSGRHHQKSRAGNVPSTRRANGSCRRRSVSSERRGGQSAGGGQQSAPAARSGAETDPRAHQDKDTKQWLQQVFAIRACQE